MRLAALLSLIIAVDSASTSRLRRLRRTQSAGSGCQFVAHRPGDKEEVLATDGPRLLYKKGSIAVVEDEPMRYLVSMTEDGRCYEQAEVTCKSAPTSEAADNGTSVSGSADAGVLGGCDAAQCSRDVGGDALLSYLRSMAGGALAERPAPARAVVIGFGSGALASWLEGAFADVVVDTVDLSADVIGAAGCFGVSVSSRLNLVVEDGRRFLQDSETVYDAIFLDAFDEQGRLPGCLATSEFFDLCVNRLSPDGGVLAMNLGLDDGISSVLEGVRHAFLNVATGSAPHETNTIVLASQTELGFGAGRNNRVDSDGSTDQKLSAQLMGWARTAKFKTSTKDVELIQEPRTDAGESCGGPTSN